MPYLPNAPGLATAADASVLIPTRNAGPGFRETLEAIQQQRTARNFELVVVDSCSSDGTAEAAAAAGARVQVIPQADFGHGRTRNLLASLARGSQFVFMTQDALPADELWLERLMAGLDDPSVAACFGRQVARPGASLLQQHHLAWWYPQHATRWSLRDPIEPRIGHLFYSHVNAACRSEVWDRFRFDESLVMSEDQEWSRRVLQAGWEVTYVPDAAVIHSHPYGLASVFRRHFDSGASLVGVTADSEADWLDRGLRYLGSELRFLWRKRALAEIPYAICFEATRYLGFSLGRRHRRLPKWIKVRLGEHSAAWAGAGSHHAGRAATTNW
ncbi:MAG TPA: glycosyltransferase family 2 protein [Patescibacteria group bacterium]|nr:glycosyltransferase family 2 protein [Patescibacteria group bacterium]